MTVTMLDNALDMVRRGAKVFPLQPGTKDGHYLKNGCKGATNDEAQIRKWWSQWPDANIGCKAGVIVDIDAGVNSSQEVQNVMKLWGLPPTLAVRSGGRPGYRVHLYFTGLTMQGNYTNRNGCRGEIRCDTGNLYVVGPGSVHPDSGERYEIAVDLPLATWPITANLCPDSSWLRGEEYGPMSHEHMRRVMLQKNAALVDATEGGRNDASHQVVHWANRAFRAGAFPGKTEEQIIEAIVTLTTPLYLPPAKPRPGGVRRMIVEDWRRCSNLQAFEVAKS
jgi:hypothetical protein